MRIYEKPMEIDSEILVLAKKESRYLKYKPFHLSSSRVEYQTYGHQLFYEQK